MNINDGGPAFPCEEQIRYKGEVCDTQTFPGMSLRDWFAGQVMVGLMSKLPLVDQTGALGMKVEDKIAYNQDVAESCYAIADAMLKAREAKP
jgi:hypothetical protein